MSTTPFRPSSVQQRHSFSLSWPVRTASDAAAFGAVAFVPELQRATAERLLVLPLPLRHAPTAVAASDKGARLMRTQHISHAQRHLGRSTQQHPRGCYRSCAGTGTKFYCPLSTPRTSGPQLLVLAHTAAAAALSTSRTRSSPWAAARSAARGGCSTARAPLGSTPST